VKLLTLDQAAAERPVEVGGKARGLARLAAIGLPVPDALVLPAAAHTRWLAEGALGDDELTALAEAASALGEPLAVRSSAADEDDSERSAAGQYESVMDVRGPAALAQAIEYCYRAAQGERAVAYRGSDGARVALVLQREMAADRAGVAFSTDPVTGAKRSVVIEAVFGHGEGLVSGSVTPDRYSVDRESGEVRARLASKRQLADGRGHLVDLPSERRLARTLRDHEARAVAELVRRAEDGFGTPVDVEFCFAAGELWTLQCRPITTLDGHG
jgi:phosphoenolpyruvate synthase/pyruvate phosphate dikinase